MPQVAIIGAGPAGLTSAKEALECGLTPTVFEKSESVGGLWKPGTGQVWETMSTNISYHGCTFSDFPWKKEQTADYPSAQELHAYLTAYADHFQIHPHIQLQSEVTKIERANAQWQVSWRRGTVENSQTFDDVIVCSGIFSKAFIPPIAGIDTFPGEVVHSKDYKSPASFQGKTVAVIGSAFSALEIAADLTRTADKVVNIIRNPVWILPRYIKKPNSEQIVPGNFVYFSRAAQARAEAVDETTGNQRKHAWSSKLCTRQTALSSALQITTPPTSPSYGVVNDAFLDRLEEGKISVERTEIQSINGNCLHLENGVDITADALLFATGYRTSLPFLDPQTLDQCGFSPDDPLQPLLLLHTIFPPTIPHLFFVGMYRGPFMGVIELQARNVCMTISGKIPLPTEEEMREGLAQELAIREKSPRPQFPHSDYVAFSDRLAKRIGALPNFEEMKEKDPHLHDKLWNTPFTPASLRLQGPGAKPAVAWKIIDQIVDAYDDPKPPS